MSWGSFIPARWQQLSSGSVNRRIFNAAMLVGALTLGTKLVAMGKEMLSAAAFGVGDAMDAFLAAYVLPAYAISVLAGQMNAALVPVFVEVREKEGAESAQRLFSGALVLSFAVLAGAAVLLGIAAPVILPWLCSGFAPDKMHLTLQLFYLLLPNIVLSGLVVNCESALNAGEKFLLPQLAALLVPLLSMASIWIFAGKWGVHALVYGFVAGVVGQLALIILALKKRGLRFAPRWYGVDSGVRRLIAQYLPAVAASAMMCSSDLIDQSMASTLDAGSIAALNYGNKLVAFALVVGATGLGTAVLPFFSKMVAAGKWDELRHTLKTYVGLILLVTIPLTLAGMWLSKPLVALFFQRGHFTAEDTSLVAWVQAMFMLKLPFYTVTILFVRMISSMQANRLLIWGTVISGVVNITFNYVLMKSMGVAGIALSTSIVYAILSVFLGGVLWSRLRVVAKGAVA
ncbi:MAG: murein biosynthesis integral membrane protein MurJ [Chthoniobacter sp.]|nr:murein biosynthesis integral membrane protein MurJ [Chthoniobacter sp.]